MENWIASSSLGEGAGGFAGRELQQLVRVDGDRVGVDRGRGRDRRGDDVGLRRQALHPRRDDVGAELVEQQEADHQDDQAAEIEDDDAARQRRRETLAVRNRQANRAARARRAAPSLPRRPGQRCDH